MAHQYMSKIFHGPDKNPLAPFLHTLCTVPKLEEHTNKTKIKTENEILSSLIV